MKIRKNNTNLGMCIQNVSYAGADLFTIRSEPNFSRMSRMLLNSEALSLSNRKDINALLSRFVRDGVVSEEFAMNLRDTARRDYPEGSVSKYTEHFTYVPIRDAMLLQLHSLRDMKADVIIENINTTFERSWLPTISYIQTEDSSGYGYPLAPVGKYKCLKQEEPSMMLWALIGAIVGCKDLYEAITKKKIGFEKDGWEGHALTHMCGKYARYADMKCPPGTPFSVSNSRTVESMLMYVKKVMPTELVDSHITTRFDGAADYFKFNIRYWEKLFKSGDHPSICVVPNLDKATADMLKEKDIIIVVDTDKDTVSSTMEKVRDNDGWWDDGYGSTFEARVVIGTYANMNSTPGQFEGVRWACHGNGFGKYWTQERNNASCEIMTHADGVSYNMACPQVATIIIYVKIDRPQMDQYKLDFFQP
jgi:hypothetical protein